MKPGPVPKVFDHLMNAAIKGILVLGVVLLFISGCSQPVPDPQISLYKRLGGEKTLVAVSLESLLTSTMEHKTIMRNFTLTHTHLDRPALLVCRM